ncbi:hypothetical protein G7062_04005 [Erysipelothrix sp. HDW6C]|uniref:hypothetical protein n=1 Tax=Erysipelothrix sp. HDW6C TaxID=2714930 RepID=UPI001407FF12|nr:hypothetical protein [Erysipelothrix sp. HDW6C]QIK69509.1 hypothetical protein G7062_04005 [Erysipelothrix sp. HDW6C]
MWELLKIEPTTDLETIRLAYFSCVQEEGESEALNGAYNDALNAAITAQESVPVPSETLKTLDVSESDAWQAWFASIEDYPLKSDALMVAIHRELARVPVERISVDTMTGVVIPGIIKLQKFSPETQTLFTDTVHRYESIASFRARNRSAWDSLRGDKRSVKMERRRKFRVFLTYFNKFVYIMGWIFIVILLFMLLNRGRGEARPHRPSNSNWLFQESRSLL